MLGGVRVGSAIRSDAEGVVPGDRALVGIRILRGHQDHDCITQKRLRACVRAGCQLIRKLDGRFGTGGLGAIRRVLRIEPIRATTDTGSELS